MIRKNVSVVFRSIIICILLIVPALLTSVYAATVRSAGGVPVINPEHITGEDLVAAARKYIGSPYTWQDTWPNRTGFGQTRMFDCSGLVLEQLEMSDSHQHAQIILLRRHKKIHMGIIILLHIVWNRSNMVLIYQPKYTRLKITAM